MYLHFGQVKITLTCPTGQVSKYVHVQPWAGQRLWYGLARRVFQFSGLKCVRLKAKQTIILWHPGYVTHGYMVVPRNDLDNFPMLIMYNTSNVSTSSNVTMMLETLYSQRRLYLKYTLVVYTFLQYATSSLIQQGLIFPQVFSVIVKYYAVSHNMFIL